MCIRAKLERSAAELRVFHGKDNLGSHAGGHGISGDTTEIRKGCCPFIPTYWSFIHSLLGVRFHGLKRVIVTGGTGGLGRAIVEKFRRESWEVVSLGRKDLDLLDRTAVKHFFEKSPCDLLICAAGNIRDQPISRMIEKDWDDVVSLNFSAASNCAEAALKGMAERKGGHIVFISSFAALHPAVGQSAYASAKASLLGLTSDLAARYGRSGIRINAVLPGFLETPMTEAVSEKRKEAILNHHSLGKFNTVQVAADFLWFLQVGMPFTSGQYFQLDSRT